MCPLMNVDSTDDDVFRNTDLARMQYLATDCIIVRCIRFLAFLYMIHVNKATIPYTGNYSCHVTRSPRVVHVEAFIINTRRWHPQNSGGTIVYVRTSIRIHLFEVVGICN